MISDSLKEIVLFRFKDRVSIKLRDLHFIILRFSDILNGLLFSWRERPQYWHQPDVFETLLLFQRNCRIHKNDFGFQRSFNDASINLIDVNPIYDNWPTLPAIVLFSSTNIAWSFISKSAVDYYHSAT